MSWGILALALVSLGMVSAFVGLYVSEIKKRYKAVSEKTIYELGLKEANKVVDSLVKEKDSYAQRLEALKTELKNLEATVIDTARNGSLRSAIDKLLSG